MHEYQYPWTPVLVILLILLALTIVRVMLRRKSRPLDRAELVHRQFHTGSARRFPEFCEYCRSELTSRQGENG
jgi:hypothetical protein